MRSYAVIPPLMLDSEQKRYPFMNENGLLTDIVTESKVRQHRRSGHKHNFLKMICINNLPGNILCRIENTSTFGRLVKRRFLRRSICSIRKTFVQ